jgi:peptidoglycan hydrolase-like protein with peptidoglycan-binding domain
MQHALKALKYKISIDGQIGPETRTAVRAFQAKNGFIPDAFPTEDLLKVILKKADLASQ